MFTLNDNRFIQLFILYMYVVFFVENEWIIYKMSKLPVLFYILGNGM